MVSPLSIGIDKARDTLRLPFLEHMFYHPYHIRRCGFVKALLSQFPKFWGITLVVG